MQQGYDMLVCFTLLLIINRHAYSMQMGGGGVQRPHSRQAASADARAFAAAGATAGSELTWKRLCPR